MLAGVHAILGHRGSGKSKLARAVLAPCHKLIVIDTLGEHGDLGVVTTVDGIAEALRHEPEAYRFVLRPMEYETVEWLERVAAARPGCTLFVDEIDNWYPDYRATVGKGLASLAQYGRHYNQGLVAVARRPASMSHTVLSQASLWCFAMHSPPDRKRVMEYRAPDPIDLRILRECPADDGGPPWILETEVMRTSVRGVQRGTFNLETGQFSFPSGESFSSESP